MNVHALLHAEHEDTGCIEPWLLQHGHALHVHQLHAGAPLPRIDQCDWLLVMGGPMNIYEHAAHPWLVAEKQLIRAAVDAGKRVLGICLGAQLLADVLGGPVTRNAETEIGWFDVVLNDAARAAPLFAGWPERFAAFHWHGDTFAVPPAAQLLMSSAACAHQAFAAGPRVVGLQFHLEVTAANARDWLHLETPAPARYVQDAATILADVERFAVNNRLMHRLLAAMAA